MALGATQTKSVDPPSKPLIRAAQYVRMSTEHQKYSTENQADIIASYAALRGMEIVRTYADEGKSGLRLEGRLALQQLLDDVAQGRADFTVILVYDVSRWGRFQDTDESAHNEYICKQAGVIVHYCAEQFENDGSLSATIIKSMKRAMAGEYSRELSAKVFTGQCRLITLGFRQGGTPGYGLRRQLVDEQNRPKAILAYGEHKSLQTDRVVLVAGPADEVATVRRMYKLFIERSMPERQIATILNTEGIATDLGRPWTRGTVHQVLTNEKYVGHNVYNRMSFKLKRKRIQNGPESWVRANDAFEAIVDQAAFDIARRIIAERSRRFTDAEMLEGLKNLYQRTGWLSGLIIDEQDALPSSGTYRQRFGNLMRAYELVGYSSGRDYRYLETNRLLRSMHPGVVSSAIVAIGERGGSVRENPRTDLLTINDEFTASIVIVRCAQTQAGSLRWKVRLDAHLRPDITVAVRMAPGNREVQDYYLLPSLDLGSFAIGLAEENGFWLDTYRFDDLSAFFSLAARVNVRSAA